MSRSVFFLSPLLTLFIFLTSFPSIAKTISVCKTCEIQSIQSAIDAASVQDTINVKSGRYDESIRIEKPLHLIGEDGAIVDGGHRGHVLYVKADDVTVEGLSIENSGASDIVEYAGIYVDHSQNCTIRHNRFQHNIYSIYLAKVGACVIEGNHANGGSKQIVSGGNGIHIWGGENIAIRDNRLEGHRDGIYLEFVKNSTIERNISTKNGRYGLHFMYAQDDVFDHNHFIRNETGVAVMYSNRIVMTENRFEQSWGQASYGLLLKDITDSEVSGNRFFGNTIAVFADSMSRNQFRANHFTTNAWAISILGSSQNNTFVDNQFTSNHFDVVTNARESTNRFEANYWGAYRGYDLDRDGFGDVPFHPMRIFSLWLSRYPEFVVLLGSPVVTFLEAAERVLPILTPRSLEDLRPRMGIVEKERGHD